MLTGSDSENNVVAKWTGEPIHIRPDPQGNAPVPPPDEVEQFKTQIRKAVEEITRELETAQQNLKEPLRILQEAKDTAANLILTADDLKNTCDTLQTGTIPEFKIYTEKALKALNSIQSDAAFAAQQAVKAADQAQNTLFAADKLSKEIATLSHDVGVMQKDIEERANLVAENAQTAVTAAQDAESSKQAANDSLQRTIQLENNTRQYAENAKDAAAHAPRINESKYWEIWNPQTKLYERTDTRAQLVPRGEYSAQETYHLMDVVSDTKASYLALKESHAVPLSDKTAWMVLAAGLEGKQGDVGRGLTILGQYETVEILEQSVPSPQTGDAYSIGKRSPYNIYIYNGTVWVDNGKLASVPREYQLTLLASAWTTSQSGFTQTVSVPDMVEDGEAFYEQFPYDKKQQEEYAKLTQLHTKVGSIVVTAAEEKPIIDLSVRIVVIGSLT